jgi:hypothetical protein
MTALRGRPVQVLAALPPATGAGGAVSAAIVHLAPPPLPDHVADGCLAATPDAWPAFAILTGVAPAALAGSVILVDAGGWLRAVIHTDGETDIAGLVTPLLAEIVSHPIAAASTGGLHVHH